MSSLATGLSPDGAAAQSTPPPVSPICALAFEAATTGAGSSPPASADPSSAPSPIADVFLPRWATPKRVEPLLLSWWRRMFRRIAAHEAQHIRIAKRAIAVLPRRMIGKPCSAFQSAFGRWSSALTRQQDAFDIRDRQRPLPPYRGSAS